MLEENRKKLSSISNIMDRVSFDNTNTTNKINNVRVNSNSNSNLFSNSNNANFYDKYDRYSNLNTHRNSNSKNSNFFTYQEDPVQENSKNVVFSDSNLPITTKDTKKSILTSHYNKYERNRGTSDNFHLNKTNERFTNELIKIENDKLNAAEEEEQDNFPRTFESFKSLNLINYREKGQDQLITEDLELVDEEDDEKPTNDQNDRIEAERFKFGHCSKENNESNENMDKDLQNKLISQNKKIKMLEEVIKNFDNENNFDRDNFNFPNNVKNNTNHNNDGKARDENKQLKKEINELKEKLKKNSLNSLNDIEKSLNNIINFNKNFDIEKIYTYMENTWLLINGYSKSGNNQSNQNNQQIESHEQNNKILTWINVKNIDKKHIDMENINKK